ncbi:hypothetical protein F5Y04DRAFT_290317 [Hypomontagnella monticulosa]|nr:hypothetical protein F5Y04DRAFT_290317 [Hypomontagnella monticulosa]
MVQLTQEKLKSLQHMLQKQPELKFLRETLIELPSIWPALQGGDITLPMSGLEALEDLSSFALGSDRLDAESVSNIYLAPLTIVLQAVEFIRLIGLLNSTGGEQGIDPSLKLPNLQAVQGFCLGFLSSAAVACSRDWSDLEKNYSVSIRIAACIGMVVEAESVGQTEEEHMVSVSVSWKTDTDKTYLEACLDMYPNAYVSCLTDENRVTITLPRGDLPNFTSQVGEVGMTTQSIGLHGVFHNEKHVQAAGMLKNLFQDESGFQLPDSVDLKYPLRSNGDGCLLKSGHLHDVAVDTILCRRAHWYQVVKNTLRDLLPGVRLHRVGEGSFIPRSLSPSKKRTTSDGTSQGHSVNHLGSPVEEIAVVGMSCRFPSANSTDEFWQMLSQGKTSIGRISRKRFDTSQINREPKDLKFWGNFLDDEVAAAFDHRFFGLSGREAKSMDPQQRLVLQVAYEALESAGYHSSATRTSDVGFYLGVGSVDYEENVASDDATAFSALGTLRAFLSGRVSHHFGWSGPSVTLDTACSSSAVAIHTACQALLNNECSMALTGGVNVITGPTLYQNLAAASFLSPSGSSKAFDAAADGYCRGEGAGIVVLKRLSEALADGDLVFGVIAGSAVNQGSNCSPITVPHSESQTKLYRQALSRASITPEEVAYVEAHGTGTPVGDPIEYESIRMAFTSRSRANKLFLGSVKDNVGHTEAASGVTGLIKCLLMMEHGVIPKQANFSNLNPKIKASEQIVVPRSTQPWSGRHVALVNNYGAAGSNAALVLREHVPARREDTIDTPELIKPCPLLVAAKSKESLASYLAALREWLPRYTGSFTNALFNIARRQNPSSLHKFAITTTSVAGLISGIDARLSKEPETEKADGRKRPVILCFGGQNGRVATLSKEVYDNSKSLRDHLDKCDIACRSLGLPSIYPRIFDSEPHEDLGLLHCTLFSIQYATAMAWIDSGLDINTLIGHSFGQLTALCVAGSISLEDSLKFISGRAHLLADACRDGTGSMTSVEAGLDDVKSNIDLVNSNPGFRVEICCYNGPQSFVLGGNDQSMKYLEQECAKRGMKFRKLENTHAYHSYVIDPVLPDLRILADSISIQAPVMRVETCSEGSSWSEFTSEEITRHTRDPVYFADAVRRISKQAPSAVWIEAGSASPIIPMARRALGSSAKAEDVFIPLNFSSPDAFSQLSHAVCQLWEAGSKTQFWPFQQHNRNWTNISVPPYQFEKVQHWIDYKAPSVDNAAITSHVMSPNESLLIKTSDEKLFMVNKACGFFDLGVRGHAVVNQSLCPASMYVELAVAAAQVASGVKNGHVPRIEDLTMDAPLGLGLDRPLYLRLSDSPNNSWTFQIFTSSNAGLPETYHASGKVCLIPFGDPILATRMELSKRLARIARTQEIQESPKTSTVSGPMVYEFFSSVVDYATYYQGVESVAAGGNEAVGLVKISEGPVTLDRGVTDPISLDNFLQVAGIHVNCLSGRRNDEVFICTKMEELLISETFIQNEAISRSWTVYSKYHRSSDENSVINDIFVYDFVTKDLVLVLMGAAFHRVTFKSLQRSLSRLNNAGAPKGHTTATIDSGYQSPTTESVEIPTSDINIAKPVSDNEETQQGENPILKKLRIMFSEIMEIPLDEVQPTSTLDELGVDSLMATEVLAETNKRLTLSITPIEFQQFDTVQSMCLFIQPDAVTESTSVLKERVGKPSSPQTHRIHQSISEADTEVAPQDDFAEASQECFLGVRGAIGSHAEETGFADFCSDVLPSQNELVTTYIVEALATLGCSIANIQAGEKVMRISHEPKHQKLIPRLYEILEEQGLVAHENGDYIRTAKAVPSIPSSTLFDSMIQRFPGHTSETRLLHTTGHRLADCLSGTANPLSLIFQNATARSLLEDVYTNAPMFKAATMLLAQYLAELLQQTAHNRSIRILELGAGTGGTTKYLVKKLQATGRDFTYTFTDLSPSLVAAARRKFSDYPFMKYEVMDIEKQPDARFLGAFDIVLSSNCIHATRDLVLSTTNIHKMLKSDGILCLVELTQTLPWFDLVFGLLEGWWLFNDGRKYVLADEHRWERVLREAGFQHVDWSDDANPESSILRVIVASASNKLASSQNSTTDTMETVVFKHVDGLDLHADIYYPTEPVGQGKKLPVALMIHGGGHVMLSRKDVRPDQTKLLLEKGFLPISVDYRLCPEATLQDGPMKDVADALIWARTILPNMRLRRRDIKPDGSKVVSIGWSTGGFLALSLGWNAPSGTKAPDATLALYCPSDYEDEFWTKPNIPTGTDAAAAQFQVDDIWDGVFEAPITGYNIPSSKRAIGGWLSPSDARSKITLYMNWQGRALHVLLQGLDCDARVEPPAPSRSLIEAVSLHAQIRDGRYTTPTFLIHPRQDDLIPWEQAHRTYTVLEEAGVETELRVLEDVGHLFDMVRGWESNEAAKKAVMDGYNFLCKHVGL